MRQALSKTPIEDFKVPEEVNLPGLNIEPEELASGYLKSLFDISPDAARPEQAGSALYTRQKWQDQ